MKRIEFTLVALLTVTIIAAVSIFLLNSEDKVSTTSQVTEKQLLFVYDGENVELATTGASRDEFTLTVPIASKDSQVTWFTDRPVRDAGHLSYENFVKLFYSNEKDSFEIDPPNVAIQIEGTTFIAKMTSPKIVVTAQGGRSIVANFVLVPETNKKDLLEEENFISSHITRSSQAKSIGTSRTLKWVSVFVDDLSTYTMTNVPPAWGYNFRNFQGRQGPLPFADFGFNVGEGVEILGLSGCTVIASTSDWRDWRGNPLSGDFSGLLPTPELFMNSLSNIGFSGSLNSLVNSKPYMKCDVVTVMKTSG